MIAALALGAVVAGTVAPGSLAVAVKGCRDVTLQWSAGTVPPTWTWRLVLNTDVVPDPDGCADCVVLDHDAWRLVGERAVARASGAEIHFADPPWRAPAVVAFGVSAYDPGSSQRSALAATWVTMPACTDDAI